MSSDHSTPEHPTNLEPAEVERLFQHGLHEEGVFYSRLNFFLLFESLLLAVAIAGLSKQDAPPIELTRLVCGVGFFGSVIWWYAQLNKLVFLKILEDRIKATCREFEQTIDLADKKRLIFKWWSANAVLAYTFPPLFIGASMYLLYYLAVVVVTPVKL